MSKLTAALLRQQDDVCSVAVLNLLRQHPSFQTLAASEGKAIIRRDKEDDEKLAVGIDIAKSKGLLSGDADASAVHRIDVSGKSAQEVTEEILRQLPSKEGNVIVIQGLSGTGKGTTVNKLQRQLPRCVTWSNGNVFRSYTLLCLEALGGAPITTERLTPDLLRDVSQRVAFKRVRGEEFDIILKDTLRVAEIQNTALKAPEINAAVPTVAQQTQGEVIRFGAAAVRQLSEAGYNVILEGRAQTLNYISTPLRFEFAMDDVTLLGGRRAAQRVMAKALSMLKETIDTATEAEVEATVLQAVEKL